MIVLGLWRFSIGSVAINDIRSRKAELFYWMTILFSNTLGTALGDFFADSGLGYERAAVVFAVALAIIAAIYVLYQGFPDITLLVRVHPYPSARRDGRRSYHQAYGHGWTEPQSHKLLFNHRGAHDWMDSVHA